MMSRDAISATGVASRKMMKRLLIGGAAALFSILGAAGCGFFNSSLPTYRYRLTINVDTPAGPRSGSGVVEVRTTKQGSWNIDSPGNISRDVFGEAVAVDLPNGKTLFAVSEHNWSYLFLTAYAAHMATTQFPFEEGARIKQARKYRGVLTLPARAGEDASVPGRLIYPRLVQFGDISDPASAEWVEHDDFAASFGPGYALRSMTVEVTSAPISTGIDRRLPWLGKFKEKGGQLNGKSSSFNRTKADELGAGSFDFKTRTSIWEHL